MRIGDLLLLLLLPPLIQKVWKLWNWSFLKSIDKKVKLWQSHQKALASTAPWDCKLSKSWHFPLDDKVALEAQWGCSLCQARVGGCWEAEARFTSNVPKSEQAAPQLQSFLPHSVETSDGNNCHETAEWWHQLWQIPIVAAAQILNSPPELFYEITLRLSYSLWKNEISFCFVLTFIIAAYCATDFKFAPQLIRFISFYAECPLLPPVKSHSARGGSKRREWIFLTCQMTMWSKVIVS